MVKTARSPKFRSAIASVLVATLLAAPFAEHASAQNAATAADEAAIAEFNRKYLKAINDGDIDTADFAIWKKGFGAVGSPDELAVDYDGSSFLDWQRRFAPGGSAPPASAPSLAAVPEPGSLLLAGLSAVAAIAAARRSPIGGR